MHDNSSGTFVRIGARTRLGAAAALLAAAAVGAVPATGGEGGSPQKKKKAPPPGARVSYAYDGAGRLVRQGLPDGRVREFGWDRSGNRTSVRTAAALWHVGTKRPALGAWSFTVAADGSVRGAAVDSLLGPSDVTGTLHIDGADVTGTLVLTSRAAPDTETYVLTKSSAKLDRRTGTVIALTLRSAASPGGGALDARAIRPATVGSGFAGAFRSAKSSARTSSGKQPVPPTWFAPEGTRYGATVVDGGVKGSLLRDPGGLAFGTLEFGGTTYSVSGRLKDRSKRITLKTAKGVTPALTLKLAR